MYLNNNFLRFALSGSPYFADKIWSKVEVICLRMWFILFTTAFAITALSGELPNIFASLVGLVTGSDHINTPSAIPPCTDHLSHHNTHDLAGKVFEPRVWIPPRMAEFNRNCGKCH